MSYYVPKTMAQEVYEAENEVIKAKQKYEYVCRVFGDKFRTIRELSGSSLRGMAKNLGVSPAYLSDVELGRRFPNEKILNA